jgi:GT2 family glycosyltransferase
MTVGLVIVTYNAAAYIGRALAAVAAQTRPPDEVVIIDNASSDGTSGVIEQATAGWSIPVRVVPGGSNLGFAVANNRGVALLPHSDFIALLNPDAFPEPGWLSALLAAAEAHPEAGSFASRLMLDGKPGQLDGAGDVCHVSGLVWRHGHDRPERDVPEASRSGPVFAACAAAALYRREDWVRLGGLDERFFCYVEDVDLGFRLQLAGRTCFYVADAVVHHLGSASSGAGSGFAVYHGHRNLEWLFLKNMPGPLLWRYLPLHLVTWPLLLAWFTARGRGWSFVRAKWDAVGGMREAWRARTAVQALRVRTPDEIGALLDRSSLWKRLRHRQPATGRRQT